MTPLKLQVLARFETKLRRLTTLSIMSFVLDPSKRADWRTVCVGNYLIIQSNPSARKTTAQAICYRAPPATSTVVPLVGRKRIVPYIKAEMTSTYTNNTSLYRETRNRMETPATTREDTSLFRISC